jgi:hypothetical protein
MSKVAHVYSFTATYEDGTTVTMNHTEDDDFSTTRPDGSRFTDVLEKEKESKLVSFVLHNDDITAGVDLRDGHFEINGVPFFLHRPDQEFYKDFRIIYFRTVQRSYNVQTEEESSIILGYTIGWQTNDANGQNVQKQVMI